MGYKPPAKEERNKEIYELHTKGLSNSKIAKQFDLTSQRISKIVMAYSKKLV